MHAHMNWDTADVVSAARRLAITKSKASLSLLPHRVARRLNKNLRDPTGGMDGSTWG